MFCEWCGQEMKTGKEICSSCGKKQSPLFDGNGFWDLCQNNPQKKDSSSKMPRSESSMSKQPETMQDDSIKNPAPLRASNGRKKGAFVYNVISVLLLIVCVAVSAVTYSKAKQTSEVVYRIESSQALLAAQQATLDSKLEELEENTSEPLESVKETLDEVDKRLAELDEESNSDAEEDTDWRNARYLTNEEFSILLLDTDGSNVSMELLYAENNLDGQFEYHWQAYSEEEKEWMDVESSMNYLLITEEDRQDQKYRCIAVDLSTMRLYGAIYEPNDQGLDSNNESETYEVYHGKNQSK
jgi:ssDNA-binding Zn-finger/Zn-ribbon topoisomerase 1